MKQAKNDKRLKHLEAAGHDVSMLKSRSNGESQLKPVCTELYRELSNARVVGYNFFTIS